jgi:hypothetical protein
MNGHHNLMKTQGYTTHTSARRSQNFIRHRGRSGIISSSLMYQNLSLEVADAIGTIVQTLTDL